jgi:hypothetical protein
MPNLEDFVGKNKKNRFEGWEVLEGDYGCQSCDEDMDHAFFNEDALMIVWVCPSGHESKVELA